MSILSHGVISLYELHQLSRLASCFCAGGILNNLPPEQLQSFDAVMIRPRAVAPAGSLDGAASTAPPGAVLVGSSGGGDDEMTSENALAGEVGGSGEHGVGVAERAAAGASLEEAPPSAATKAGGEITKEGGMTITVRGDLGWVRVRRL